MLEVDIPESTVDLDDADGVDSVLDDESPPRIAGKLAALCRMELPIQSRTVENEMMVKKWLNDEMERRSFRKSVRAKVLPFAIQFCFVPTKYEIAARLETLTPEYQILHEIAETRIRKQTWFDWLLGRRGIEEIGAPSA